MEVPMKHHAADANVGDGKVSRRTFFRYSPAILGSAVVGGRVEAADDEELEQSFLAGLMRYPKAISAYESLPTFAFAAPRNAMLWNSMRGSSMEGDAAEADVYRTICDRA